MRGVLNAEAGVPLRFNTMTPPRPWTLAASRAIPASAAACA